MKNKLIFTSLFSALVVITIYSCKKKFDTPPLKTINEGAKLFISQLKPRVATNGNSYRFPGGDSSLFCTVTADESSGNIYKQVFVRDDAGGAIQLNLTDAGGLFVGDRLRINLNNLYLVNNNSMIYLDSVSVPKNVVKLSSGNAVTPTVITLATALAQTNPANASSLQSQLIQINGVEFVPNAVVKTFADPITKDNINQTIKECGNNKTLIVRSSGYANFAGRFLPSGNGTIMGILTQYNNDMQLTIRNYAELNMNGTCGGTTPTLTPGTFLIKDFNDGSLTSGGWTNVSVTSTVSWVISSFSTAPTQFAQCNSFINGGTPPACEVWLIGPPVDLTSSTAPNFSFTSNANTFAGPTMSVYVSTGYTSGTPTAATWTILSSANIPSSGSNFVPSGLVNLSAYKSNSTRIAFKYVGTGGSNSGRRWQVDDIRIFEP